MQPPQPFLRLDTPWSTAILDLRGGGSALIYWGSALGEPVDLETLATLLIRPVAPNSLTQEPLINLTPTWADGFIGPLGLKGHRDGLAWAADPRLASIERLADGGVWLVAVDTAQQLRLCHRLRLDPESGVLEAASTLQNLGSAPFTLEHLAAPVIPLSGQLERLLSYSGRWAGEFRLNEHAVDTGAFVRENRRGRTSHDAFPGLVALSRGATEEQGLCYGFHLGASGNHYLRHERLADGRALVMMAEALAPGEIRLEAGESYTTPTLYAAVSGHGLTGLARAFQTHVRQAILPRTVAAKPRPVHYNSWEAVYFNHDQAVLRELAERAAALGVERFVLDDGWFGARRHDRAGLGDWRVSPEVYPDGLEPLIEHVHQLGMEFGLWVEPEMVNPDSDLYRANPDWVLKAPGVAQLDSRHQWVLDLTQEAVSDYLFAAVDALLRDHRIDYLKWDMNRDVSHPGGRHGLAVAHRQTMAVHALMDRLRLAHPGVEIESCSSGGGRANFEILQRTERIWTSDSNDALDRLAIQQGCALFFPPEVMGAHVGPRACHITGRHLPIELRAAVAFFGHMGLEMDLRELTPSESATLAQAIALHKRFRPLLHGGLPIRIDRNPCECAFGVIAPNGREALYAYALVGTLADTVPGRMRLPGLDPGGLYTVSQIWPSSSKEGGALHALGARAVPGAVLGQMGFELPLLWPQSLLIFHVERLDD